MTRESNNLIIQHILSDDSRVRSSALQLLYKKCFSQVESFILGNGGRKSDVKDIFQEGMMIFYQNLKASKFRGDSSVFTYFNSICRRLWLLRVKQDRMQVTGKLDDGSISFEEINESLVNVKNLELILNELKEECRKILKGFYYQNKSMQELSHMFNLGSAQAAKNKKSRCLKYLGKVIRSKNLTYEDFIQ